MDRQWQERIKKLFSSQRLAVLSTQRDGQPHGSLVAFAAPDDLREVVFATTRATKKFGNIQKDPRVALLMDNRTNNPSDLRDAIAVTAIGEASEAGPADCERLQPLYLKKHPYLVDFIRSPSCALVCVKVRSYRLVLRFQDVTELYLTE